MVRIISDTSTLYSTAQAREAGFAVSPLAVTIAGSSYRELDEMTAEKFVEIIAQGHMPASSQPAIGEVMDLYGEYAGEEIINIAMADGLSGTYQSAVSAAEGAENITVVNTTTLCGPHRYMVETAVKLAEHGVGKGWRIYITHAVNEARLEEAKAAMEKAFPEAAIECYTLTSAFITQGGPDCVAIQVVKEI